MAIFRPEETNVSGKSMRFGRRGWSLIIGIPMILLVITFLGPMDLATSGLWYDSQGLRISLADQVGITALWGLAAFPQTISYEGAAFGLVLLVFQTYFWYMYASSGSWLYNREMGLVALLWEGANGRVDLKDVNSEKLHNFVMAMAISMFDTYTDALWKTGPWQGIVFFLQNFFISYTMFNVGSEIALVGGIRLILNAFTGIDDQQITRKPNNHKSQPAPRGPKHNAGGGGGPKPTGGPVPRGSGPVPVGPILDVQGPEM